MFETELAVSNLLLRYGGMLVADIPAERMAEQPLAGVNHPAWVLGHLTLTAVHGLTVLGTTVELADGWGALFAPGSQLTGVRADYPGKDELLAAFQSRYQQLQQAAATASAEQLAQASTHPMTRELLPTARESVSFLLTGHLGVHLGQLSTWRRLIGLPPMF